MGDQEGRGSGSQGFFAAWMLLHEKADDWLKDAVTRARATPGETRRDYQNYLLEVDLEKEAMKGIFSEALLHEFRHMGFVHKSDAEELKMELENLRKRIAGLEEKLERLGKKE